MSDSNLGIKLVSFLSQTNLLYTRFEHYRRLESNADDKNNNTGIDQYRALVKNFYQLASHEDRIDELLRSALLELSIGVYQLHKKIILEEIADIESIIKSYKAEVVVLAFSDYNNVIFPKLFDLQYALKNESDISDSEMLNDVEKLIAKLDTDFTVVSECKKSVMLVTPLLEEVTREKKMSKKNDFNRWIYTTIISSLGFILALFVYLTKKN